MDWGGTTLADGTGVVFLPAAIAEDVVGIAEKIVTREKRMSEDVLTGQPVTEVMGKAYEPLLGTRD